MDNPQLQIIFQLLLAAFLGGLVGLEREYKRKEAGLRTYSLVALGTALFTITSFEIYKSFLGSAGLSFDPVRVIQAVAVGIGFLGAGVIIYRKSYVEGLTTAAGLWIVAAIGLAVGVKFYWPAIFVAFLSIGILSGLRIIEEKYFGKKFEEPEN
jgi:putative Mg2+ transporter-C (MgtC) family protein